MSFFLLSPPLRAVQIQAKTLFRMGDGIAIGIATLCFLAAVILPAMKDARSTKRWKTALVALGFGHSGLGSEEEESSGAMFAIRDELEVHVHRVRDGSHQYHTYVNVYFRCALELSLKVAQYNPKEGSLKAYGHDPDEIDALCLPEFFSQLPIETTVELDDTRVCLKFFELDTNRLEASINAAERLTQQITKVRASMPTHVHGEHLATMWKSAASEHRFEYVVADCEMYRSTPAGSITISDWLNKRTWSTYISIELWSSHPGVKLSALAPGQEQETEEEETPSVRTTLIALKQDLGNTIQLFSCGPEHIAIELRISLGARENLDILERLMSNLLALTHVLGNLEPSSFGPFRSIPEQKMNRKVRRPRKALPPPKTCSKCSKSLLENDTLTKNGHIFCETCYWRHY